MRLQYLFTTFYQIWLIYIKEHYLTFINRFSDTENRFFYRISTIIYDIRNKV